MSNGGMTMSASIGKSDKLEVDKAVAESIYNDLLSLWNNEIVDAVGMPSKSYSLYMRILERYKEDILNDR